MTHPFHDVPGPDRYDPRGPAAQDPSPEEVARQVDELKVHLRLARRIGVPEIADYAQARLEEWTAQPMSPRKGPAASPRPGPRPDHQGGPT